MVSNQHHRIRARTNMFNMWEWSGRFRGIFRLAAFLYVLSSIVILIYVHGIAFGRQAHDTSQMTKDHSSYVRNVKEYVYINKTVKVYEERSLLRHGPGEKGAKVELPTDLLSNETSDKIKVNKKFHGFNTLISDIVSLHRKLPDTRPQLCKDKVYPDNLPPVSVVIIFRDEWHSILLRTGYSVLENSPPDMIKEVIFVDDGSVDKDLKVILNAHVSAVGKFRLLTNEESLGLMRARQKGIEATTADHFIVMDGHMEVEPGWLEPLMNRLVEEPNSCLCSQIGTIRGDDLTYKFSKNSDFNFAKRILAFDPFTMEEEWVDSRDSYKMAHNNSVEPIELVMVQGMMISMRKEFFFQLGGFDPGMKVWGSEQIELSMKAWMCGGRVEMLPCSRAAHMYRATPWGKHFATSDHVSTNKRRTIDVWMDEPYRTFVKDNLRVRKYEIGGDLSERHKIRIQNKCKLYQYFVDKVKELSDVFFPTYLKTHRNVFNKDKNRCLDLARKGKDTNDSIILFPCHTDSNQNLVLTEADQIRSPDWKILTTQLIANMTEIKVITAAENIYRKDSYWDYREDNSIYNRDSGLCLTALTSDTVGLRTCSKEPSQVWEWERLTNQHSNIS